MKNYLFLYIQTADIPTDYNIKPENFEKWPRAITISWILNGSYNSFIVRPTGFHINPETANFIGISNETAINKGKDISFILEKILNHIDIADYIVGHNIEFHLNILKSELFRNNLSGKIPSLKTICLMSYGRDFAKLQSNNGYKFPSLSELYKSIFIKDLSSTYIKSSYSQYPEIAYGNVCALQHCFNYMLESNVFNNIKINPLINYFAIPFKKDGFPEIKNLKVENSNFLIGNTIIFQNVIEMQEFINYGLYTVKISIENKIRYLLTDYRGVLIYESETPIEVGFHIGLEENGIFLNQYMLYSITFREFGIIIHQYESEIFKNFMVIPNYFKRKTVINNNGQVILENGKLIFNKDAEYFVNITNDYYKIYDLNGKNIANFDNKKYEICGVSPTNQFYFISDKKQGAVDVSGTVTLQPKYRYIRILNANFYCFSNDVYLFEEEILPNFVGLSKVTGEKVLEEIYDEIYIKDGLVIAEKDGEEFIFNNDSDTAYC